MRHVGGVVAGLAAAAAVLVLLVLGFPGFIEGAENLRPDTGGMLLVVLAAAVVGVVMTPRKSSPAVPLAAGVVLTAIGTVGVTPTMWPALFGVVTPGVDLLTVMGYGIPLLLGVPLLVAGALRAVAPRQETVTQPAGGPAGLEQASRKPAGEPAHVPGGDAAGEVADPETDPEDDAATRF